MRSLSMVAVLVFLFAATAVAQDAVQVDPKHYQVVMENDQVRVLRITYGPGDKSVMHRHPDAVAVFLTDHRGRFTLPGGKSEERAFKRGQTLWTPAETHLPENLGSSPLELILVELKGKKGAGMAAAPSEDPAKIAAESCKADFENERVRVLRWKLAPGAKTPMHAHPAAVSILLTDASSRFTLPDGTTRETQGKTGDAVWSNAEKHASTNTGNQPAEVIQIEIKG